MNTDTPTQSQNFSDFDALDKGIRAWLQSDTVFQIILDLNKKYEVYGSELQRIPAIIVEIVTMKKKPDQLFAELHRGLPFLEGEQISEISKTLKQRVFRPIKTPLKDTRGVDIELLSTEGDQSPTARTMPIEKPVVKPPVAMPAQPPRPASPPPPPVPKARVMEMTQVIDVRKPVLRSDSAKATPDKSSPAIPVPTAQTMKIEGDFSAGGPAKAVSPAPKPAGPATATKPAGEYDVLETKKEFGLAEAVPKPPQPQEIEKYEDHHPTVE